VARFRLLLLNEFKLARTALPIHLVALIQPCVFYLFLSLVMVRPTFDVSVLQPTSAEGHQLVAAMAEVGPPGGVNYIRPIVLSPEEVVLRDGDLRQLVVVEERNGVPTAVQRFGLIDSNQVKNLRNRLTAAALRLWDEALGDGAVIIEQEAWLEQDVPYMVYFGLAMLPLTVFMAGVFIGGILTAQEFEFATIEEYRLAPLGPIWVLGVRILRLTVTALLAAAVLMVVQGVYVGYWPDSALRVGAIVLPLAITGSFVGVLLGLLLRRSIPTLAVGLLVTLGSWILGSAFGLSAGFGSAYQAVSRAMPHTHVVELLFPRYYGATVGRPWQSALLLGVYGVGALALTLAAYHWRVRRRE
jgi:ABC-type multidrug transport system permease subunit